MNSSQKDESRGGDREPQGNTKDAQPRFLLLWLGFIVPSCLGQLRETAFERIFSKEIYGQGFHLPDLSVMSNVQLKYILMIFMKLYNLHHSLQRFSVT